MRGQTNPNILRPKLQRRLRNGSTDAERHLWQRLRNRQLANCKFRRQRPYFNYILDFVCLEHKLVVELDGGQHAEQVEADAARDSFLRGGGFRVLRFWNNDVLTLTDNVLDVIYRSLTEQHHPLPNPPLEGEGVKAHELEQP